MEAATVNWMNLMAQKNTEPISSRVPREMKDLMERAKDDLDINELQFVKLCILEKLKLMYGEE